MMIDDMSDTQIAQYVAETATGREVSDIAGRVAAYERRDPGIVNAALAMTPDRRSEWLWERRSGNYTCGGALDVVYDQVAGEYDVVYVGADGYETRRGTGVSRHDRPMGLTPNGHCPEAVPCEGCQYDEETAVFRRLKEDPANAEFMSDCPNNGCSRPYLCTACETVLGWALDELHPSRHDRPADGYRLRRTEPQRPRRGRGISAGEHEASRSAGQNSGNDEKENNMNENFGDLLAAGVVTNYTPPLRGRKYVNLTPHGVDVHDEEGVFTIPASGTVARITDPYEDGDDGFTDVYLGDLGGLPQPDGETIFIVSMPCCMALKAAGIYRPDVVYPYDMIRDDKGRIVGCWRLARIV